MTVPTKLADRIETVRRLAETAWQTAGEETASIMADTERALKRAIRRAEELSGEWDRVECVPTRGPTIEFTGRLLIENEYESKGLDPISAVMQIWQTKGGALVAVYEKQHLDANSKPQLTVAVCHPTDDAQEQRFAVLEHFAWSSRARSMARKLGWSVQVEVE